MKAISLPARQSITLPLEPMAILFFMIGMILAGLGIHHFML